MQALITEPGPDDVLWDVVGEHLDEAEFELGCWQAALGSPRYTLADSAGGPEGRLHAHIDALLIGGPAVLDKLMLPELEAPEEPVLERGIVAGLVLIAAGRPEVVWKALASDDEVVRHAAREAFVLAATPQLDAWIPSQFAPGAPAVEPVQRLILLDIAARRGLALPTLLPCLQSTDPAELAAALVAARASDPTRHLVAVEHLVDHADETLRDAALVAGLCYGSHHAWQRCLTLAAGTRSPAPLAMQLVALLGDAKQHEVLVAHLARKTHRHAALTALAYTGQVALVPHLLPFLSADPIAARLASAAFAMITGVDTSVAPFVADDQEPEAESLPDLDDDDLDADLAAGGDEEDLPLPDAKAIQAYWQLHGASFDTRHRLLGGKPWTLPVFHERVERATLLARQPLLLWLLIRSGGVARISGHAWSSVQRAQLGRARGLGEQALPRRFGSW